MCLSSIAPGCADDRLVPGSHELSILNGVTEDGEPGTFYLWNTAAGIDCTGALISDRVVITAKHCVVGFPEDAWTASTGPTGNQESFAVESVTTTEGLELDGIDIALMTLASAPGIAPYALARSFSWGEGDSFSIVGYGESEVGDNRKRRTTGDLYETGPALADNLFDNEFLLFNAASGAGHGDSGGPVLSSDGTVVGVMSRANTQYFTFCTRPDRFLDLIDSVITAAGGVVDDPRPEEEPTGCTGDEDCAGGACVEGSCVDTPDETAEPSDCALRGDCDSVLGELGASCSTRDDCSTGLCGRASGDGPGLCTEDCTSDDTCGAGFACLRSSSGAGVCWPEERADETPGGLTGAAGCASAGPAVSPAGSLALLASVALGLTSRRRRR